MASNDLVSVTIVTYNSGRFIKRCLESVLEQKYLNKEIIVIDNASTDGTVDILEQFEDRCRIVYNDENIGFRGGAESGHSTCRSGDWVLTLNPDVLLLPNFIQALVDAGQMDPKVGTVCGKLLTILATFDLPDKPLVDSTGIYFTPMLRHLDRGSQEIDNGHYLNHEYVFGATAAAALYRREMIEDIAIDWRIFRSGFLRVPRRRRCGLARAIDGLALHLYAAGARISRAQRAAGEPARAAAGHQHALGEEPVPDADQEHDSGSVPAELVLDYGSRFRGGGLLRLSTSTARSRRSGIWRSNWKRVLEKRREIMKRRRAKDDYIASWFSYQPVSQPAQSSGRRCCSRPRAAQSAPVAAAQAARCGSRSSAPAAFRRATAASKPSPKSYRRGSPRAGTTVTCLLPRRSIPNRPTAAFT